MRKIQVLTGCVVVFGAGCGVSRQVVEEQQAELDLCRAALNACETGNEELLAESAAESRALRRELAQARERTGECEERLDPAARALESCEEIKEDVEAYRQAAVAAEERAERLKAREEELRDRMQKELAEKESLDGLDRRRGTLSGEGLYVVSTSS